jgi:hypothetical protein
MTALRFGVGIFLLILLPFAFGLAVMSEACDRFLGSMERTLDRIGW